VLGDASVRASLSAGARGAADRFTPDAHVARLEQVLGLRRPELSSTA